jgi:hypothetical protein
MGEMNRMGLVLAALLVPAAWPSARHVPAPGPQASGAAATPASGAAAPQAPAAPALPTAQEIFEHYTQAIGGRDAWQKLTSRVSRGTVRWEGIDGTGTILVYERAPNQQLSTMTWANGYVFREGFDGKASWEQDPAGKVTLVEGARGADARADSDFYSEVNLGQMYPHAKTMGQRSADGRLAYVVEASVPGGTLRWLYFDAENWLRFRTDIFRNPLSPSPTTVLRYDDYHDVDGIKFPYRGSVQGSGVNITFRFTVLHHNVTVSDDQVARPASAN